MDGEPIKVGDRVLRLVRFRDEYENGDVVTKKSISTPTFSKSPQGQWMIRARRWENAGGKFVALNSDKRGIVCFFDGPTIPEGWTEWEVVGLARSGKAAFVKPIMGKPEELLSQFTKTETPAAPAQTEE
jgi:hypothetical protein